MMIIIMDNRTRTASADSYRVSSLHIYIYIIRDYLIFSRRAPARPSISASAASASLLQREAAMLQREAAVLKREAAVLKREAAVLKLQRRLHFSYQTVLQVVLEGILRVVYCFILPARQPASAPPPRGSGGGLRSESPNQDIGESRAA